MIIRNGFFLFTVNLFFYSLSFQSTAFSQVATYDTILEGLHNPTSVAIQPGTGHVFVADSGALRVIRVVDGKAEEVITGFSKDVYGKGPSYEIGPLGLLFVDEQTLLVGRGGKPDGEDSLSVYKIPAAGEAAMKADKFEGDSPKLAAEGDVPGEGNFYALVSIGDKVYVTCNGDDKKSWIAQAKFSDGKLTEFARKIALKPESPVNAPTGIAVSPEGYLAIAQMGTLDGGADSVLTFYDPEKNKFMVSFETGTHDLTGIAYGPKRGRLFATDFNWADKANGALVKLVADGEDKCIAEKILTLDSPTALTFAENGDLYVTLSGEPASESKSPSGKLILIKGLDAEPKKVADSKKATDSKE